MHLLVSVLLVVIPSAVSHSVENDTSPAFLHKCCNLTQQYNLTHCIESPHVFNPPVYENNITKNFTKVKGFNVSANYEFQFSILKCNRSAGEDRFRIRKAFHILKNGSLHTMFGVYDSDKYCVDSNLAATETKSGDTTYNVFVCIVLGNADNSENLDEYIVKSTCMLISCFFIILTVGVYAWLPELRNLHGMVLMAYLLSFFVSFMFLAALQILIVFKLNTSIICKFFTYIIYYSLLAAFFWMNVMCYDIWWTFSGNRLMPRFSSSVWRRFVSYSLYAFGVPTALTLLLAALEFTLNPLQSVYLPRIILQGCFLTGYSKMIYLYGPITLLCVANLVFFTMTALKIAGHDRDSKILEKEYKQRFRLYIKLFILMGFNWILEVISAFYPEGHYIWLFTDAYNVLIGLTIFIIFVCKPKIWNKIKDRYRHTVMGLPLSRSQTTTTSVFSRTASKDGIRLNSIIKN